MSLPRKSSLLTILCILAIPAWGYGGTWLQKADLPIGSRGQHAVLAGDRIYVLEGYGFPEYSDPSRVFAYDPVVDSWSRKADLPIKNSAFGVGVVDEKIYVIGGTPDIIDTADGRITRVYGQVYSYDPTVDAWSRKADMPTPRGGASIGVAHGRIYALGGFSEVSGFALGYQPRRSVVESYDPAADTWTRHADSPLPNPGSDQGLGPTGSYHFVDEHIYALSAAGAGDAVQRLDQYDPATGTWSRKADMPTPRNGVIFAALNGQFFALGGSIGLDLLARVETYDPATGTWTRKTDMPLLRQGGSAVALGGRLYLMGGTNDQNRSACGDGECLSRVDVYDPSADTWTQTADKPTVMGPSFHTLALRDKIFAIGGDHYAQRTVTTLEVFEPDSGLDKTAVEAAADLPPAFALHQNHPNPFNAQTLIRFLLPSSVAIELALYNPAGQKVATLAAGHRAAGAYVLPWDGRDDAGGNLASGVYLYRLRAGDRVETRKLLLVR